MNNTKKIVSEKLLAMVNEIETPIWNKPWTCVPSSYKDTELDYGNMGFGRSFYHGVNQLMTEVHRFVYNHESRVFLTNTDIDKLNGYEWKNGKKVKVKKVDTLCHLKKGAKSCPIIFYTDIDKKDEDGNPVLDENGNPKKIPLMRYYLVFNSEDIEGYDFSKYEPKKPDFEVKVEDGINACEAEILERYEDHPPVVHGGNGAYYSPLGDYISVPTEEQHRSSEEYLSTLAHELTHSTGIKTKLNRECFKEYSSDNDSHCLEELVAEFGASMICGFFGMEERPMQNSANYIAWWNKRIKENPNSLLDAIRMASKAYDYIMGA